jgi:hypothetical protein
VLLDFFKGSGLTETWDIFILAGNGYIFKAAFMGFNKLLALDKNSARTAAGVINSAALRFNHLNKDSNNTSRSIELAAALALRVCELPEEILVHSAEHVFTAALFIPKADFIPIPLKSARNL